MTNALITRERDGPIGWLTINRPARHNTLTAAMWRLLAEVVEKTGSEEGLRVLVLRGGGESAFCAGADIDDLAALARAPDAAASYADTLHRATRLLADLSVPTIAMIRGHCVGGGCALAFACDLRIADDSARLALTPAKLGLVYALEDVGRLVALTGPSRAKELLFTARTLGAEEARAYGLIDRLVAADRLEDETRALADDIATNAPRSVRAAKRFVARVVEGIANETNDARRAVVDALTGADLVEGAQAFRAHRAPRFDDV